MTTALLLLTGCGTESAEPTTSTATPTTVTSSVPATSTATPTAPATPYSLSLEASVDGTTVVVTGTSNLPENAEVVVSASRAMRVEQESDERAANLATNRTLIAAGTFETELSLDFSDLLFGLDILPIETLDSHMTICAEFQTGNDFSGNNRQPDAEVRAIVGDYGEALEGSDQVDVFGSATANPANWLEASVRVEAMDSALDQVNAAQPRSATLVELEGFCLS